MSLRFDSISGSRMWSLLFIYITIGTRHIVDTIFRCLYNNVWIDKCILCFKHRFDCFVGNVYVRFSDSKYVIIIEMFTVELTK